MNHRKKIVVLIFFFVLGGISACFLYLSNDSMQGALYAQEIPLEIDGWKGTDLPVEGNTIRILETEDVLFRIYEKEGELPVYLSIVFSENNRKSIHPPEVCYTGSGWEVAEKEIVPSSRFSKMHSFDVIQLLATQSSDAQLIYYWYKSGKNYTSNIYWHQWNMIFNQIFSKNATGSLIRLSTLVPGSGSDNAEERLNRFTRSALPLITKHLP